MPVGPSTVHSRPHGLTLVNSTIVAAANSAAAVSAPSSAASGSVSSGLASLSPVVVPSLSGPVPRRFSAPVSPPLRRSLDGIINEQTGQPFDAIPLAEMSTGSYATAVSGEGAEGLRRTGGSGSASGIQQSDD